MDTASQRSYNMAHRHTTHADAPSGAGNTASSKANGLDPAAMSANQPAIASIDAMRSELLTVRSERDDLFRRFAAMPQSTQNASIQLTELNKAMQALRQARDGVMA